MRRFGLLVLLALFLAAAPAQAQNRCEAPPGTAAIDQYCERQPTAQGDRDMSATDAETGSAASQATLDRLERSGEDGQALADSLERAEPESREDTDEDTGETGDTGGGAASSGSNGDGGESGSASSRSEPEPSNSPVDAVQSAAANGATLGGALPWALLVLTIVAVGVAWARLRSRRPNAVDS